MMPRILLLYKAQLLSFLRIIAIFRHGEIGCVGVGWIPLAQGGVWWWAFMNTL
jgi:hypothetical protein